jgi:hypothetical protein
VRFSSHVFIFGITLSFLIKLANFAVNGIGDVQS